MVEKMQVSPELFQYMSLLETERGIREILGTLTGTQESRLALLREDALAVLTPQDKSDLRVAMGNEKPMAEVSAEAEKHWAQRRGCVR